MHTVFFTLCEDFCCAVLFNVTFNVNVAVTLHTRSSGNKLTDNNVLLKADKVIHLALNSSIGKNLCGLLEGCRR